MTNRPLCLITRAALFVAVGAILNLGVAWGTMYCSMSMTGSQLSPSEFRFPDFLPPSERSSLAAQPVTRTIALETVLNTRWELTIIGEPPGESRAVYQSAGIPCTCVEGWLIRRPDRPDVLHQAVPLRGASGLFLPMGPVWPALLVNTALYAALSAAVAIGCSAARRNFRSRRSARAGACAHCGYSLTGRDLRSDCPECGAAR